MALLVVDLQSGTFFEASRAVLVSDFAFMKDGVSVLDGGGDSDIIAVAAEAGSPVLGD